MNCSFCKAMIDDDSYYCDQCGEELMVCGACGKPGKGKRCIYDGKKMITAKEAAEGAGTQPAAPSPGPGQTAGTPAASAPAGTGAAAGPVLTLVNSKLGVELPIKPGTVVGRANGELVSFFQNYNTVSSTHARFDLQNGTWTITDLGSTNGTFLNNQALQPNQAVALTDSMMIKFADVDFLTSISGGNQNAGTVRLS